MRTRIVVAVATALSVAALALGYESWRSAGHDEMRAITERIASDIARADREALRAEPLLQCDEGTAAWFLQSSPELANGYRVTVRRNGAGGHYLMSPEVVTH